jgi:hypothetical protein
LGGIANIEAVVEQEAFGGETFVLRGPPQGQQLIQMIHITLVVGAGKQGRQKYDPQATRWVNLGLGRSGRQLCTAMCGNVQIAA